MHRISQQKKKDDGKIIQIKYKVQNNDVVYGLAKTKVKFFSNFQVYN